MSVEIAVTEDLATCQALRRTVFIEEQNVPEADEVDGRDAGAVHLLARVDGRAVGTARLLVSGDSGKIGRVCVLAEMRGKGIGARLIEAAVREFAANPAIGKVKLSAQINALSFYERLGFTAEGDEYLDAGIVHRDMFRTL
ncbi:ElaA protein [Defluviimonas denitrificans]|jgi:ElaA protein|uniref:ElaA protein n=1 Tax=Albidovulum denitrificans TaxID=404881 RepID=A0A2S8RYN6_9RHOB|nr:GNAT family N-acetyltransferase [Defluviimonas denitrificans]PQV53657.1 ElaA protein [Defluviimonas denitrificans]